MDNTPQYPDELEPLSTDYARSVVAGAANVERIQKLLPQIPDALIKLVNKQPTDFLFGVASAVQALHDLIGTDVLLSAAEVIRHHEENEIALSISSSAVQLVGLMEALGYIACKEIVKRSGGNGQSS